MGRYVNGCFVAEFTINQAAADVWKALQAMGPAEPQWLSAWPRMPGFDTTAEIIEREEGQRLLAHKHSEPCKDSEIEIRLTEHGNDTLVTAIQSKLPDWVEHSIETFVMGGNQIIADLILYLDRGVVISRHAMPWAFSGILVNEVDTGLEVTQCIPGTYGQRVGLLPGDLLLTLGGAPVFSLDGLQTLTRVLKQGEWTSATWVRGREVMQGDEEL